MKIKMSFTFLLLILVVHVLLAQTVKAQQSPNSAPKGPAEKTFTADFDFVWEKVVEVLTEKGLSEHPHGKMSANKDSGKITTPTFRYFKIFSAKPVVENHYRDAYTIDVSEEARSKEKVARAKEEEAKGKIEEAKGKIEEAKGKSGDEAKALLEEAKMAEGEAKTLAEEAKKAAEAAKMAAAKEKVVKVQIQRKFEIHDDVNRNWINADPVKDKVGYTEEFLLKAIEARVAAPSAVAGGANPGTVVRPNLNLTPPVIVEAESKPEQTPIEVKK